MDERKKQVLNAVIKDYIANAEPVGSRAVAKKYGLGVSPATIRNEMSDLTDEGYIEQPHTSAGRIPSAKGYRFFVDNLMEKEKISRKELLQLRDVLATDINQFDDFMHSCANIISQLTNYPAMVTVPESGRGVLANIQLVYINEYQILTILLASTGIIRHKLIELHLPIKEAELARIEAMLKEHLIGKDVKAISYELLRDMLSDYQMKERLAEQAFDLLEMTLSEESAHKIFTGGVMNMLSQPEFHDIDKLKKMFSLMEEKEQLAKLFQTAGDNKLTVTIGGEMPVEGARDCSMVVANYYVNGEKAGSVGVLGPTRLNYGRTVSMMELIAEELSKAMADKEKGPK